MSECHARITHHNAKLDKQAKVLEKELRVAMDSQNHVSTILKNLILANQMSVITNQILETDGWYKNQRTRALLSF